MTAALVDDWLGDEGNRRELAALGYIDPERIQAATPELLPRMEAIGRHILRGCGTVPATVGPAVPAAVVVVGRAVPNGIKLEHRLCRKFLSPGILPGMQETTYLSAFAP